MYKSWKYLYSKYFKLKTYRYAVIKNMIFFINVYLYESTRPWSFKKCIIYYNMVITDLKMIMAIKPWDAPVNVIFFNFKFDRLLTRL